MTTATASAPTIQTSVIRGIIGGIAGGIVFGLMMAMMNMLPMVGMLIGNDSAIVGFGVHMVISIIFGVAYGVVATRVPSSWGIVVGVGVVYGVILWVAGALIAMPLILGMNEMVLQIGEMQWQSLMGHIIFGVILTVVYKLQASRA